MMGLLDSLDPQTQGLLAAGFQGLQASGPSRMPVSLGQIIGQAGSTGLNEYQQALQLKRQRDLADLQMQLEQAKIEKLNRDGALTSQLLKGGLLSTDPNSIENTGTILSIMGHQGGPALLNLAERQRKTADAQNTLAMLKSQQTPITETPTAGFNQNGFGVRSVIPPNGPMVQPNQMPSNLQATEPIPPEVVQAQQSGQPFSVGVGPSANPADNTQRVGGLFAGDIASTNPTQAQQGLLGQSLVDNASGTSVNPQKFIDMQSRLSTAAAARQQAENQAKLVAGLRNPPSPIAIMGPDNKPVYVPASEAVGKTPATAAASNMTDAVNPDNAHLHGEDYIATLPPGQQNVVRGLISYQLPLNNLSMRTGERKAAFAQAAQADPNFNVAKYQIRQGVMKDFTSGKIADNLTALDQAVNHMGTLSKLATALENNDIPAANAVVNYVRKQTGDPRVTNFATAQSAVGTELMRVFRQVNASEVETKDWISKFPVNGSPQQIQQSLRTGAELLAGRMNAINTRWNNGMDVETGYPKLMSSGARTALETLRGENAPASAYIETKKTADGRILGKKADGTIEVIK